MNKTFRALVVDDSEKYAESVLQSLQESGYRPILKRVDSFSAMNTAIEKQGWDFVIADYFPAPFNAVSALKLLKDLRGKVEIREQERSFKYQPPRL